ncbi:cysteine proteinase [Ceratobasidium sp. AG-I]|nr:cysteine proteinase [Ceratobasidium sp. AG-I]
MLGFMSTHFKKQNAPENQQQVIERGVAPPVEFKQQSDRAGLLCTEELQIATERCRKKVQAIAKDCRERNVRYRDIEFDLEEDKERCLHGLETGEDDRHSPSDVLRVTQIFENPQFFIDGVDSSDVSQGGLGDCWFISAMSVVSSMEGLIDRICVARDEQVGIYGFIFYRDCGWVDVIIDDLLYTLVPKFEELSTTEKRIYHNDKEQFDLRARKGGKSLYFAKSKTENETWVPLLEKAYAKLHGDYSSLNGGFESEAIEDMTGGLSTIFHVHDILDTDRFWNDQLLNANKNVLFGCYMYGMEGWYAASEVKGLHTLHAYSVLEALEVGGKRFLRLRNPWGESEWTGRWSDGSKEWTPEWLARLPELKHKFGDDGEFLMEYSDFLKTWTIIERSRLFDSDWKMSNMWLNVNSRSFPCAWNFGDVSFTFSVSEDSPAVLVLSQLDDRYFQELSGYSQWSMDFVVYRKGAPADEPYTRSSHTVFWRRSVNVELNNLEAGDYVLHVRLDRDKKREKTYYKDSVDKWNQRKLSKVWAEACVSKSIAVNFNPAAHGDLLPASFDNYGGQDLTELELSHYEKTQTKPPVPDAMATPLAMLPTEAEKPKEPTEEAVSESSSTVVVGLKDKADEDEDEDKSKDKDKSVTEALKAPGSKPGGGEKEEGQGDDKDKDDKKDDNDDKDKGKDDKDDKDKKDGPPPNPDMAGPGPAPVISSSTKGPDEVIHEGFSCNECKISPIVGSRYHCLDASCNDYDLCSKCMDAGKHDPNHQMLCIRNPVDANKLEENVAEGEDNSITLGLRVYTKGNAVTTLSGQLRHGKVIGWKKKEKGSATPTISPN